MSPRNEWWTPEPLRSHILSGIGHVITLDAAACAQSRLVPQYLGPDHEDPQMRNALAADVNWGQLAGPGGTVFVDPPFLPTSTLSAFLKKAVATAAAGTPVVGIVPASPTTDWFIDHITEAGATVQFVRGRPRFTGPHATGGSPRWGVALIEW